VNGEVDPWDARGLVEGRLAPGEDVMLITWTDVARDGTFGERFLFVTSRRVTVFSPGET